MMKLSTLSLNGACIASLAVLTSASMACEDGKLTHKTAMHTSTKSMNGKAFSTLPQKSNGSGVRVAYKLDSVPEVGKPLTISLQMDRVTHDAGATLEVNADKDLSMDAVAATTKTQLAAKRMSTQQIVVTPMQEGLFYVNLFTEQAGRKSASAIAIRVGNKPIVLPTVGTLKTDANGEKVVSMRAQ